MPIVTFWSNNKKAIGQTVAASAAATVMAMEHNYKVILISVDFFNDSMEECFGAQQSNAELIKSLIAAITEKHCLQYVKARTLKL